MLNAQRRYATPDPVHAEQAPTAKAGAFRRKLVSGGAAVIVGSFANNLLSFLFSFVIVRLLAPGDYATVTACLSLLVVTAVPASTLQLVAARYAARWEERQPGRLLMLEEKLVRVALLIGTLLGAGMLLASPALGSYLQLNTTLPLVIVAAMLLSSFLGPVFRGILQGRHRFGQFATVSASEFGFRLLLGVPLTVIGWRAAGPLVGVLLASVLAAGIGYWYVRSARPGGYAQPFPYAPVLRWAIPTLLVQLGMTALLFQDTLFAKHFFDEGTAGGYAGLATTGRLLVYFSGALASFLFPVAARLHLVGARGRTVSHITLALAAFASLGLLGLCAAVPTLVLRIVVGAQYLGLGPLLAPLALAMAAYAVMNLLVSYLLAVGNRACLFPVLIAPAAQALLLSQFHRNLAQFIHVLDVVMLTGMVVLLVIYWQPVGTRGRANETDGLLLEALPVDSA